MLLSSLGCHAALVSPQCACSHFGGAKTNPLVLHDVCGAVQQCDLEEHKSPLTQQLIKLERAKHPQ